MKTRLSKKLLLIIVLAGAAAGIAYLVSGLVYVPDLAQFEVTGELAKTRYDIGEEIAVEPFLTYYGMRRVTICSGIPLLFVEVYTAENEKVLELPVLDGVVILDILWSHTLRPNAPFNDKDRWHGAIGILGGHPPYDPDILDYLRAYNFRLEQAGSYYVVVRAEFWLDKNDPASASRVCSEPIWVQITD